MLRPPDSAALEVLVLLHPDVRTQPHGTAGWLARRPVGGHVLLRRGHAGDVARLARPQSRQAVGLVFVGGSARGLAHLGAWRAPRERGIEIGAVGGTSIGGVMAALVASDRPYERLLAVARRGYLQRPTGNFNLLPLISLIRARRMCRVIEDAMRELWSGALPDIGDLWRTYILIAANCSKARQELLRRGPLAKPMRAGLSIPGALPPGVHRGDLLCDGGTFNKPPVDVMRGLRGVGRVIGVDLHADKSRVQEFDEVPSPRALLHDRWRPRASSRRASSPMCTSAYLNPPMERVGMLRWAHFDEIVQRGYEHASQVLDAAPMPAPAVVEGAGSRTG